MKECQRGALLVSMLGMYGYGLATEVLSSIKMPDHRNLS